MKVLITSSSSSSSSLNIFPTERSSLHLDETDPSYRKLCHSFLFHQRVRTTGTGIRSAEWHRRVRLGTVQRHWDLHGPSLRCVQTVALLQLWSGVDERAVVQVCADLNPVVRFVWVVVSSRFGGLHSNVGYFGLSWSSKQMLWCYRRKIHWNINNKNNNNYNFWVISNRAVERGTSAQGHGNFLGPVRILKPFYLLFHYQIYST